MGSPLGSLAFIEAHSQKRLEEERKLLDKLNNKLKLQTAWLLLYYCAAPRANHILRTLPPAASCRYAAAHDQAVLDTFGNMFSLEPATINDFVNRSRIEMPMRFGGLGLRNSQRTAPAAYWASWADSLETLSTRVPRFRDHFVVSMAGYAAGQSTNNNFHSLCALHAAAGQ